MSLIQLPNLHVIQQQTQIGGLYACAVKGCYQTEQYLNTMYTHVQHCHTGRCSGWTRNVVEDKRNKSSNSTSSSNKTIYDSPKRSASATEHVSYQKSNSATVAMRLLTGWKLQLLKHLKSQHLFFYLHLLFLCLCCIQHIWLVNLFSLWENYGHLVQQIHPWVCLSA